MAMMTAQMELVDRLLEDGLAATLRQLYSETSSWEQVARRLFVDHKIDVTGQTVRRWARSLDVAGEGEGEPTAEAHA